MFRFKSLALACVAASSFATGAGAATILVDSGERIVTMSFADPMGQSFTAIGTDLQSIGVQFATLNPSGPQNSVTVALREGDGLDGTILRELTLTPANVGRDDPKVFTDFDFSGITLELGSRYTFTLTNNGSGSRNGIVFGPNLITPSGPYGPDAYADGRAYFTDFSGNCQTTPDCDLNFRVVTADIAAAVPEPASWAMMISGFGLVGGALRRGRKEASLRALA